MRKAGGDGNDSNSNIGSLSSFFFGYKYSSLMILNMIYSVLYSGVTVSSYMFTVNHLLMGTLKGFSTK